MARIYKPSARQTEILVQELDDETLVYHLGTNKAVRLNSTSALVWHQCDGTKSSAEIAETLSAETGVPVSEQFVELAVEQLEDEGLLEARHGPDTSFAFMSRRRAIKRLGQTSALALPMIASMVAPSAAHAASCLAIEETVECSSEVAGCFEVEVGFVCPNPFCCSGYCHTGGARDPGYCSHPPTPA